MRAKLLSLIFPNKCIFCGAVLSAVAPICICGSCAERVPYYKGEYLFEGAGGGAGGGNYCDRIVCALKYTGDVRKAISKFKFNGRREYGFTLAAMLCERIIGAHQYNKFDLVTCVPLSRKRLHERGYNQAEELAKHVACHLNLPFEAEILLRDEHTLRQSSLKRAERRFNVESAFQVNTQKANELYSRTHNQSRTHTQSCSHNQSRTHTQSCSHNSTARDNVRFGELQSELLLRGACILLIDDIATSMSTINACAASLKSEGATEVVGAVLAAP